MVAKAAMKSPKALPTKPELIVAAARKLFL